MSPRTPEFEVEQFEHVAATPGTVLLRISGRWRSDQRERLSPPALVIDDGRKTHRLLPLPGPEDSAPQSGPDAPEWRGAFSAPAELLAGGGLAFALDAGRDILMDLPRPRERGRGGGGAASPAAAGEISTLRQEVDN